MQRRFKVVSFNSYLIHPMNRRPFSFRSLASVATADSATNAAAAMSYRPHFRGGRPQFRRGYCDRPVGTAAGERQEFVSGDSPVRDANSGFRPYYNAVPPPPQYFTVQQSYGPRPQFQQPGPPPVQMEPRPGPRPFNGNHPPGGPAPGNYQQLRPQPSPQQFRRKATKPPDYREWEYRKMELIPPHCEHFTVLSYNILGDYLASDHWHKLYFHIPRYIMDWNWRKKNIIFELGLWSADILCFQEVDRFQDIEAELNPRGYCGIWKMRTGRAIDGCAIFWRASRFKLIYEESIEYNKLGLRDNVAQICVFEKNRSGAFTLSTRPSSASSNRVVVCNIHVLFNPRRGDIKLGQIRVLLERANAVSKLWDDAPIVLCGDFNCTPESPMYNFIKEKELDLSELARDKISGQASAEIGLQRAKDADTFTQTSAVNSEKLERGHLPADSQSFTSPLLSTNAPFTGSFFQPGSSDSVKTSESCFNEEHRGRRVNGFPHDTVDSCVTKGMPTSCVAPSVSNQSVSSAQGDMKSPIFSNRGTDGVSALENASEDIHVEATEGGECVESDSQTLSDTTDNQIELQWLSGNHSDDLSKTLTDKLGFSQLEGPSKKFGDATLSKLVSAAVSNSASTRNNKTSNVSASCESTSSDIILDQKFEGLSLDEVVDDAGRQVTEDFESFLSELHSAGQSPFSTGRNSSFPIQKLHNQGKEIQNQYFKQGNILAIEDSSFDPSAWTPADIEIATGSANCKVMEHPLKLTSAYTEVESSPGLRDSSGEPFVTSYHRRFSGTVDYIWHSQGVETVKVLAPIAKHVMHQTGGFPTKKWGSDHIALVSEFVFTKDISSETPKQ